MISFATRKKKEIIYLYDEIKKQHKKQLNKKKEIKLKIKNFCEFRYSSIAECVSCISPFLL